MKNGVKNGKQTQFSKVNQPSNMAKSFGWQIKRQQQQFMDTVMKYQDMTLEELMNIKNNIPNNHQSMTIGELTALTYVLKLLTSDKFLLDWMDRFVGKAGVSKEPFIDSEKKNPLAITIIR